MFGIPGKAAVTLTPAAVQQIARLMARDSAGGLRIGVKKGGWLDEIVEQDGARVLIAPMAQMFLIGTEIDYETSLLEAKFSFRNPNVSEACGCGESIKFKDAPAA